MRVKPEVVAEQMDTKHTGAPINTPAPPARPRLLLITSHLPGPRDSGFRVYPHLLLELLHDKIGAKADVLLTEEFYGRGLFVPKPIAPSWVNRLEAARHFSIGNTLLGGRIGWHLSSAPEEYVSHWSRRNPNAPIVVNHTRLATWFDHVPTTHHGTRLLLTHDVIHLRHLAYQESGIKPDFHVFSREEENNLLSRAHKVTAIQASEAAILATMIGKDNVLLVPPPFTSTATNRNRAIPGRCLFVGGAAQTNVIGLKWFLKNCWPKILESFPTAMLDVCGAVNESYTGQSYPHVTFHGRVDRLESFYAGSSVCLVPLCFGSGIKLKLLEAIAQNCPVVSTSVGLQGLSEIFSDCIPPLDAPDAFSERVLCLLQDESFRKNQIAKQQYCLKTYLDPIEVSNKLVSCLFPQR
jgi:hypothetical protein